MAAAYAADAEEARAAAVEMDEKLQAAGIQLELLAGPLTGIYDPDGMGSMLFAVLAVAAQLDRGYIREKPWRAKLPPRPGATTAGGPRSSTTTCSPSPSP